MGISEHAAVTQVAAYRPLAELVPAQWLAGNIVATDGTRLHYTRTGGNTPALVLLHGIIGAGLMWLRIAQALEQDFDVVMPDMRGHGRSSRAAGGCSISTLPADTAALIGMLGLERPTVIGHSLGAEVAGQLAAAYPDCVRAVVLVDPPLYPFPPSDHAEGEIPPGLDELVQAVAALQTQTHAQRLLTMLDIMPPDVTLSLWDEADYSSRVEAVAQFDPNVFRYHLGTSFIESPETIERIAYPLLLMSSRVVVPDEAAAPGVGVFETNWRNGRHVHVPDSGHYIPNERFGRFVEVVRRFLSE